MEGIHLEVPFLFLKMKKYLAGFRSNLKMGAQRQGLPGAVLGIGNLLGTPQGWGYLL